VLIRLVDPANSNTILLNIVSSVTNPQTFGVLNGLEFYDQAFVDNIASLFIGRNIVNSPRTDQRLLIPAGLVTSVAKSNAVTVATGAAPAELKDGGVGDVTFVAQSGRQYRIAYNARIEQPAPE